MRENCNRRPDGADYDEADTCWHILTTTRGGTVSILKNLDAPTARQARSRLEPVYREGIHYVNDGDIAVVQVLGPEGQYLSQRDVEEAKWDNAAPTPTGSMTR